MELPDAIPSELLEVLPPVIGHFSLSDIHLMGSACGVPASELATMDDIDPASDLSDEDALCAA